MSTSSPYSLLFSPIKIGAMTVRNRIVLPPMATVYAGRDGAVTQQLLDYYEERAKGGVGLLIAEYANVHGATGLIHHEQLRIDDDKYIPGLKKLADVIKKHGSRAAIQLGHGGGLAVPSLLTGPFFAPSAIKRTRQIPRDRPAPREMTVGEIQMLVECFAQAARRAKEAGFEGVELHFAHRYLGAQVLSGAWNQRTDEYGGSPEKRARFLLEIVAATRKLIGRDFPFWARINGAEELVPEGVTIEESVALARMLEKAGTDAVDVSYATLDPTYHPMTHEPAHSTPYAQAVKKAVSIPVMTVGRMYARLAERILQEGKADLICIGRGLIAGPDFAVKNAQGKGDDVMPCIACDNCRDHVVYRQEWMRCAVNPVAGRERELAFRPAAKSKQVVIVGGGPAGMEAARIAAQRGHRVTLFEKDTQLGGQLLQAAAPPNKVGIPVLTKFLVNQLKKLEVKVELGKAVTAQDILASKPQAVIVATGVKLTMPEIVGLNRMKVVMAGDVLLGKAQVGKRVVVIGGELVGCETADVLSEQGKKVTVTRRGPRMAEKMQPHLRSLLLHRLAAKGVTLLTGVKYEEVTPQGLKITHEGKTSLVEADTLVVAAGAQPDNSLHQALQGKVPELYLVGDAMAPRKIESAMEEGHRTGLTV